MQRYVEMLRYLSCDGEIKRKKDRKKRWCMHKPLHMTCDMPHITCHNNHLCHNNKKFLRDIIRIIIFEIKICNFLMQLKKFIYYPGSIQINIKLPWAKLEEAWDRLL